MPQATRRCGMVTAFAGVALGALVASGPALAAPLTLDEVLTAARSNLDASMAARSLEGARADVLAADHTPVPQLSARVSQIDAINGIGPGNPLQKRIDKGVGLDWTWERGGKRALRTESARRSAAAAEADLAEVRTQQALAAASAYVDLIAAQQRLEQVQALGQSAEQMAATARRRVQAGDAAQQEAARSEMEALRALADADTARLDVQRARFALALLIGRERDAAQLEAPARWPISALGTVPAEEALPALVEQRSDLRAAAERVAGAQAAAEGALAQRRSDITWGASVDHYPGTSTRLIELRLSMPLQWGYRYEGETARAQAQWDQARDALEKTRRTAMAELRRLRAEAEQSGQALRRHEQDILPRAREVAARSELAYTRGATPLTELIESRRSLRTAQLDAIAARAAAAKATLAWQIRTAIAPEAPESTLLPASAVNLEPASRQTP